MSSSVLRFNITYSFGVPRSSCCFVVAHFCLHSGKHSDLLLCSDPFGFVHSYMHRLRQAWNLGSVFVPFKEESSPAKAGLGREAITKADANLRASLSNKVRLSSLFAVGDDSMMILLVLTPPRVLPRGRRQKENPILVPKTHIPDLCHQNSVWKLNNK